MDLEGFELSTRLFVDEIDMALLAFNYYCSTQMVYGQG